MKIVPLGKRILLSRKLEPEQTASGLFIPDSSRDPMQKCDVLAISDEISTIQVNDIVIIGKYAGAQVEIDGQPCFLVELEDVLGKVV